jgi:TatD DNase family protein
MIPLNRILVETDAPYVSPVPNRGKRNDPTNLKYIIQKISTILGVPEQKIEDQTFQNALYVYSLENLTKLR